MFLGIEAELADHNAWWTSTNGRDWQSTDLEPSSFGPQKTTFGWLASGFSGTTQVSADGVSWHRLDLPTFPPGLDPPTVEVIGDALFMFGPDVGEYEYWLGRPRA
jgi:hypothetical protein